MYLKLAPSAVSLVGAFRVNRLKAEKCFQRVMQPIEKIISLGNRVDVNITTQKITACRVWDGFFSPLFNPFAPFDSISIRIFNEVEW